ncbi:MAG: hypothetical protein HWE22_20400, partial [Flavobacteriales bacterium]|nr:hypothetical protein [Flavobacteriales bacterium]
MGCPNLTYNPVLSVVKNRSTKELTSKKSVQNLRSVYSYSFQGMEADDEVKGEKNSYTTHFRQYDPRIGRWLSLDPKMAKYPSASPYNAYHNNPIYWTDPFGDDPPTEKQLIKELNKIKNQLQRKVNKAYRDITKALKAVPFEDFGDLTDMDKWKQYVSKIEKSVVKSGQEIEHWFEESLDDIKSLYGEVIDDYHFAGVYAGVAAEAD